MDCSDMKVMKKGEIFEKAHQEESSELSRKYFESLGLRVQDIILSDCEKLSRFIQDEMYVLLADKSYSMVTDLRMHKKIRVDECGIFLYTDGSYFSKRQAISIEFNKTDGFKFIGFCGWASGCNRIPFIKGFVKWCDWMKETQEKKNE